MKYHKITKICSTILATIRSHLIVYHLLITHLLCCLPQKTFRFPFVQLSCATTTYPLDEIKDSGCVWSLSIQSPTRPVPRGRHLFRKCMSQSAFSSDWPPLETAQKNQCSVLPHPASTIFTFIYFLWEPLFHLLLSLLCFFLLFFMYLFASFPLRFFSRTLSSTGVLSSVGPINDQLTWNVIS